MKNILCYGDSNTWGADPAWNREGTPLRHPAEVRWTGLLQRELGSGCRVYEAGLCSRTTAYDDPLHPDCNGLTSLPMVLNMTMPLDLVVFMLGTNDAKRRLNLTAVDLIRATETLVRCVRAADCGYAPGQPPAILIVAPVPLSEAVYEREWGPLWGDKGIALSRELAAAYRIAAERSGCAFADAGAFAEVCPGEGVHLDGENHRKLAAGLLPVIRSILE